jgi:3-oxocholest-4-en-26-oate---CoA ligase
VYDEDRQRGSDFNLAEVHEAIAEVIGDREALISSSRRLTWNELTDRTRRLANFLLGKGLTVHRERHELNNSEAGQDRVAILLCNRPEYIETMVGSFKARLVPCNVNYRYTASELRYLFADMAPAAVVFEGQFATVLESALAEMNLDPVLLEVGTTDGSASLTGAIEYEDALASSPSSRPDVACSPDDLYILYTGGTTGSPKGVLWRQADVFVTALGGRDFQKGAREWSSIEEFTTSIASRKGIRALSAAPFMHGTGQWIGLQALHSGGAIVIPNIIDRFDANDVLDTVSREGVNLLAIAGESFAKPILTALQGEDRNLSALNMLISSGAALTPQSKRNIISHLEHVRIRDTVGSSEAGPLAQVVNGGETMSNETRFTPDDETFVLDEKKEKFLEPGHHGVGWLARGGRIPLGYLNDPEKTFETFRNVQGVRVSVPGDRAVLEMDGTLNVLGRDSVTINSGGEKIYAEEVESVILKHPDIRDVIVVGRQSERWGSEVTALIETEQGVALEANEILELCALHIARYKLPKNIIVVERVMRSPAGKPNYAWARQVAEDFC